MRALSWRILECDIGGVAVICISIDGVGLDCLESSGQIIPREERSRIIESEPETIEVISPISFVATTVGVVLVVVSGVLLARRRAEYRQ